MEADIWSLIRTWDMNQVFEHGVPVRAKPTIVHFNVNANYKNDMRPRDPLRFAQMHMVSTRRRHDIR